MAVETIFLGLLCTNQANTSAVFRINEKSLDSSKALEQLQSLLKFLPPLPPSEPKFFLQGVSGLKTGAGENQRERGTQ